MTGMKNSSISGLVMRIVDGNTFVMSIHTGTNSTEPVKYTEKIRIHGMKAPSISTLSGILAKLELEKKIVGHKVKCEILERDDSGHLVAILPEEYLLS